MPKPRKKKTVAKRSRSKNYGGKSSFILSFPSETPSSEIVKAGAEKGLVFNTGYVSAIRSLDRRRKAKGNGAPLTSSKRGPRAGAATTPRTPARELRPSKVGTDEQSFFALVLRLGTAKAEELLARVKGLRV